MRDMIRAGVRAAGTALLALATTAVAAAAQTSACRSADDQSASLVEYIKLLVTTDYQRLVDTRVAYQLPAAADSEVVLVTSDSVCVAAAQAYSDVIAAGGIAARGAPGGRRPNPDRALPPGGTGGIVTETRRVFVVKVRDRYVVVDPEERAHGEWNTSMIFNATLSTMLAMFAG